jgi:hypothetical protein
MIEMKAYRRLSPLIRVLFTPWRALWIRLDPVGYLKWQYRFITGRPLNLHQPTTYTEKLQYLRHFVYPLDPLVIKATDRVTMRDMLMEKRLKAHLIPSLGVYERVQDIPWDKLPNQFVIKCTHGSGMNVIVYDKRTLAIRRVKRQLQRWLRTDYGLKTLERHYSPIPRKILIETYLGVDHSLPIEYKIHVFHGQAKYLYVVTGRGQDIRYTHFLMDWTPYPGAQFNGWRASDYPIMEPPQFKTMVAIAEKLATPFPFVRVDLYAIKGKIYVSELTFTPAKGTLKLADDKIDREMGGWLHLDDEIK